MATYILSTRRRWKAINIMVISETPQLGFLSRNFLSLLTIFFISYSEARGATSIHRQSEEPPINHRWMTSFPFEYIS